MNETIKTSILKIFPKVMALKALLLGQLFIFRTMFQPGALSSDIQTGGRGLFTKYNMLWFKCILGLMFFELVSILLNNKYTTKENKN